MSGIFIRICTACGKKDQTYHNRADKPRIWVINNEITNGDPILCNSCSLKSEYYRKKAEDQKVDCQHCGGKKTKDNPGAECVYRDCPTQGNWWEYEKKERERLKYWTSHCRQCGKESSIWHYIFDKRAKKLTWSCDNAPDPINQWVFCTENHFKTWLKKLLEELEKAKQGELATKSNQLQEEMKELKEKLKKIEEENNQPCDQCGSKLGDNYFYNNGVSDGKRMCSNECYSLFYGENCDKCSKRVKVGEKSYYANSKSKTGTLCASCWQAKKDAENASSQSSDEEIKDNKPNSNSPTSSNQSNDNSDNDNSPSPTFNNPFQPNKPSNGNNGVPGAVAKCKFCEKEYSSEVEHGAQNPNCQKWGKIMETALNNNKKGMLNEHSELNKLPKKYRISLIALQDLKINKEWVNIDGLDIPEKFKEELTKVRDEMGITKTTPKDHDFPSRHDGVPKASNNSVLPYLLIGGLVLIFFVILVVVVKKRKKKKVKKIIKIKRK